MSLALRSAGGGPPATHETVNRPCEVCGSEHVTPGRSLRYAQFGLPGPFELVVCSGCGLVFNSPRLVPEALARLYDSNYYVFAEPPARAFERVTALYRATVAELEARVPAGTPMLEIGSAKGYMQALMADRGFAVQGVELSGHAAAFARHQWQVPVFHGTLERWVEQPGCRRVAAAYCTDVIEHVPSPSAFLKALHRATLPGATVLIGTPNIESDGVAQFGDDWLGFNPFHVWLFSRGTLERLLRRCGFEPVAAYSFDNVSLGRYPPLSPVKRVLRDAAAATGLLSWIRRRRSFGPSEPDPAALAALRAEAGRRIRSLPAWREEPDGRHPRAAACRGDNLVVIARRDSAA